MLTQFNMGCYGACHQPHRKIDKRNWYTRAPLLLLLVGEESLPQEAVKRRYVVPLGMAEKNHLEADTDDDSCTLFMSRPPGWLSALTGRVLDC